MPIVFGAALDQDVKKERALTNPRLYEDGRLGVFFTVKMFWWHILEGIIHGAIVYTVVVHTLGYSTGAAIAMGSLNVTGTSATTELGSMSGLCWEDIWYMDDGNRSSFDIGMGRQC